MTDGEFHGKVVAITGAAGGIGNELCAWFAEAGAAIAALDRSDAVTGLADRLRRTGATVERAVADIGDARAVASAFDASITR